MGYKTVLFLLLRLFDCIINPPVYLKYNDSISDRFKMFFFSKLIRAKLLRHGQIQAQIKKEERSYSQQKNPILKEMFNDANAF